MCSKIGLLDYQVLDPKSHGCNRAFPYVLVVGNVPGLQIDAKKIWQTSPPDQDLPVEDKKKIFNVFVEVQKYLLANKDPGTVSGDDIPRLKDLEEFLKEFKGQVLEMKMPDGRLMGVYPDGERLQMKYSVEHHVSTILNLARLKDIFDIKRIVIKDL